MHGSSDNIEKLTLENTNFRQVLYTGVYSQLVLMCLRPHQEIGLETHPDTDQFFRIEAGQGKCVIDDQEYKIADGSAIVVPAGAKHNVLNTSSVDELKLYTIYSPPHHQDGVTRVTKQDAEMRETEFDGVTSESL